MVCLQNRQCNTVKQEHNKIRDRKKSAYEWKKATHSARNHARWRGSSGVHKGTSRMNHKTSLHTIIPFSAKTCIYESASANEQHEDEIKKHVSPKNVCCRTKQHAESVYASSWSGDKNTTYSIFLLHFFFSRNGRKKSEHVKSEQRTQNLQTIWKYNNKPTNLTWTMCAFNTTWEKEDVSCRRLCCLVSCVHVCMPHLLLLWRSHGGYEGIS